MCISIFDFVLLKISSKSVSKIQRKIIAKKKVRVGLLFLLKLDRVGPVDYRPFPTSSTTLYKKKYTCSLALTVWNL